VASWGGGFALYLGQPMPDQTAVVTVHADRGDPIAPLLNPLRPARTMWRERDLLRQLARREIVGRYRGSQLGFLWALLTPLLTLGVFTLVFGTMLGHRWHGSTYDGALAFPMNLFMGIIMFGIFSEVVGRAATLVTTNPNFVKKAVFPLELLGVSAIIGAVAHSLMTLLIQFGVVWYALGTVHATSLLLPIIFVPAVLVTLGVCWALAALGVFFRDLASAVGPVVQLLFFLTPIVYPMAVLEAHPAAASFIRAVNPFVTIVESARAVVIEGCLPDWGALAYVTMLSFVMAMAGYVLFMKVRRYFADAM